MYIALGICFIVAAKDPLGNAIIIDFTIISSVLHGLVMLYYSFALEGEHLHLAGDVPLLFVLAAERKLTMLLLKKVFRLASLGLSAERQRVLRRGNLPAMFWK